MPNVTYISHTGETTTIDVPVGTTVMENAIKNGIRVALQAVTAGLNAHIAAEFAQREPVARS